MLSISEDLDEQEAEHSNKIVSLPPQEIAVGSGDVPITQISCGMHHTGSSMKDIKCYVLVY